MFEQNIFPWLILGLVAMLLLVVCFVQKAQLTLLRKQLSDKDADQETQRLNIESLSSNHGHLQAMLETTEDRKKELEQEIERYRLIESEKHAADKLAKQFEVNLESTSQQLRELKDQFEAALSKYDGLNATHNKLSERHAKLESTLDERERNYREQLAQFDQQKLALSKEFENLANKIFEEKGKNFNRTSQESLEGLLKPFREQISEFRRRVDTLQKENSESSVGLSKELEHLRKLNQDMATDAKNLTSALKGDKKKTGSWGEVQLEKTLQLAGLVKGDHYDSQAHFKNDDGKHNYPDFVVNLPDNKHLIIDSKVSLVDYDAAIAADSDEKVEQALTNHTKAVRKHIDDLSAKDYSNLIGVRSPSFVLMFMPIEPAYIEALKHNNDLFNYGYQKGVIMVSHTTLMPILRTVANLWAMERSHAEVKAISDKAGDVYNQVCTVAERLHKLGATLASANNHYNSTVKALAGQQGLYGKVNRFSQLSNKVTKSMPSIDAVHADIELERLEIVRHDAASLGQNTEEKSILERELLSNDD